MSKTVMNCCRVKRRLSAYLDGEVTGHEKRDIEEHVKLCSSCSFEMKTLREICLLLKEDSGVEPSSDFLLKVFAKIKKKQGRYSLLNRDWTLTPSFSWIRVALLLILSVAIGISLGSITSRGKPPAFLIWPEGKLPRETYLEDFKNVPPGSMTQVYLNVSPFSK